MSKKTLLLNAVQEMLDGNIDKENTVCENLGILTRCRRLGYRSVSKLCTTWGYYSGEPSYPVGGEVVWNNINFSNPNLWWTGEQLELRMSLLEHIKSELLKLTDEEVEEMFGDN